MNEQELKEIESQAEAWCLIESHFPSLAYTARKVASGTDGAMLYAQTMCRIGKMDEVMVFERQSTDEDWKALSQALFYDLEERKTKL